MKSFKSNDEGTKSSAETTHIKRRLKTAQRESIMDYLKDNTSHPSAGEIYDAVSAKIKGNLSLATVYNTLSMLKQDGQIIELDLAHGGKR